MPPILFGRRKEQASSPSDTLRLLAAKHRVDIFSHEFADKMDAQDPLREFRKRFSIPKKKKTKALKEKNKKPAAGATEEFFYPCEDPLAGVGGRNIEFSIPKKTTTKAPKAEDEVEAVADTPEECIYLCGNSFGLKPHKADSYVKDQLDKWEQMDVEVAFEEPLPEPLWDQYTRDVMGRLVGGEPSSVILMNSQTVNLHLLLLSFYRPTKERYKILIEDLAFPFDRCAMKSQAQLHGFDADEAVLEISSRPGEYTIRTEDILKVIEEEGPRIAVICLSGVQYTTGQKLDMAAITEAAHAQGCLAGWDLAHAVGNVKLELDKWDVDFACWCTFKYLNSGAGGIAGAYVNKRYTNRQSCLKSWWSKRVSTRNDVPPECDAFPGVDAFRLANPPPILLALVMASLEIFNEVGMDKLVEKQSLLTGYLEVLLKHFFSADRSDAPSATVITPSDVTQRGCQLSVEFSCPLDGVQQKLKCLGVMCDVRMPNVLRLAPVPLYNSFRDVFAFTEALKEVFEGCTGDVEMS